MIDLYFAPTANGQRASLALEECGLAYRLHRVDLTKGQQRTAEYLAINPAGQIPAIVDPDGPDGKPFVLTQSCAIILYAAERAGRFLPAAGASRMVAMQWMLQLASDVAGTSGTIFRLENTAPEKSAANADYFKQRLLTFFGDCDRQLEGREFLAGEISVADLALYPNYAARKPLIDAAGGFANLHRWGTAMAARPGVQKGMSPAG
ncbi:MAG: glutathione S-transferase N-terminal domain-containing protein [Betaproteobacteria bacterium]|nr:glutathione S-transferase N-terminal domain-containing protein [Betaproteobacteria bacterium]